MIIITIITTITNYNKTILGLISITTKLHQLSIIDSPLPVSFQT